MIDFAVTLPQYEKAIRTQQEIILTNIVMVGQTPCLPDKDYQRVNYQRVKVFMERICEAGVDECTQDSFGNPRALLRGRGNGHAPIVLVAHMDTSFDNDREYLYSLDDKYISGPGMMDNSLGVGVLVSIPAVLKALKLSFKTDIYLIGLVESLRESDLRSARQVVKAWKTPICSAICVEGGELGRLDYFSRGMVRAEVDCRIPKEIGWSSRQGANALIVLNDIINRILEIPLPLRPKSEIILGKMQSGFKHGQLPLNAHMGFEIHSDSDDMVEEVFDKINDICRTVSHQSGVTTNLRRISSVSSANLAYNHPLIRTTLQVMEFLNIDPKCGSSESELSVFLSHHVPAITLGITQGENYHQEDERALIEPIFKGISQVVGVLQAIDEGFCDEG